MAAAPTPSFVTMSNQPPRTVQALVNEETRAPPPVRLYPSQHRVSMTRYATSTDPRGYIPVFEYPLNGQYIMIDCETGMVHFTGIWKALGHTKADVVKLVESDPTIAPYLRKVRGGYLKIQGTWLPFETAQTLARRVAWQVRYDLIPLFGPEFPDTCLGPGEPGFGQLLLSAPKARGRRGGGKKAAAAPPPATGNRSGPSSLDDRAGGSMLQHSMYSSSESSRGRISGRPDTIGPLHGYASNTPQSRYSPYNRVPSHGITQLEPLPSLVPPSQPRPHHQAESFYMNQYQHGARPSVMPPVGSAPPGFSQPVSTSPSGSMPGGAPLPPMRNHQASPPHSNFFETYRGPDSFEALSNRWLSETSSAPAMPEHAILTGDNNALPRIQYNQMMPRREGPGPTLAQYNFSAPLDAGHPVPRSEANPPEQLERGSAYLFDQQYEPNFSPGLLGGGIERRSSSSPHYPASNAAYESSFTGEGHPNGPQNRQQSACPAGFSDQQKSGGGNQLSSPNSHSSQNVPKSPSPSSASTSTHMQQSHPHHSHRSSQNNLGSLASQAGLNARADEMNQFSVLTSPAHLDVGGQGEQAGTGGLAADTDWNSSRNASCVSPAQTLNA